MHIAPLPLSGERWQLSHTPRVIARREHLSKLIDARNRFNARAADLYDALRDLLNYAEDCASERDERPSCIDNARRAIANAERVGVEEKEGGANG